MDYSGAVYFERICVGKVLHSSTNDKWLAFYGVGIAAVWVGSYASKAGAVRRVKQFARGARQGRVL